MSTMDQLEDDQAHAEASVERDGFPVYRVFVKRKRRIHAGFSWKCQINSRRAGDTRTHRALGFTLTPCRRGTLAPVLARAPLPGGSAMPQRRPMATWREAPGGATLNTPRPGEEWP